MTSPDTPGAPDAGTGGEAGSAPGARGDLTADSAPPSPPVPPSPPWPPGQPVPAASTGVAAPAARKGGAVFLVLGVALIVLAVGGLGYGVVLFTNASSDNAAARKYLSQAATDKAQQASLEKDFSLPSITDRFKQISQQVGDLKGRQIDQSNAVIAALGQSVRQFNSGNTSGASDTAHNSAQPALDNEKVAIGSLESAIGQFNDVIQKLQQESSKGGG